MNNYITNKKIAFMLYCIIIGYSLYLIRTIHCNTEHIISDYEGEEI